MYLADYHTHSRFSADGRASMLDMARAAAAAGLDEICFTDHFEPVELRSTTLRASFDWAGQTAEFQDAVSRWDGPVKLRLGLELGDAPVDIPGTERLLEGRPDHDFVIGSVHMLSARFGMKDMGWLREPDEQICYAEV